MLPTLLDEQQPNVETHQNKQLQREQTLIPVDMDQEEVALRFQKYALISAAVVDEDGRLVGMITVDDVANNRFFHTARKAAVHAG